MKELIHTMKVSQSTEEFIEAEMYRKFDEYRRMDEWKKLGIPFFPVTEQITVNWGGRKNVG